jgi:penicillin-binding protein 2
MFEPRFFRRRSPQKGMEIEFEEILLDTLAQQREKSLKKLELPLSPAVFLVLQAIFLLVLLVFFFKTAQLQIGGYNHYTALAEQNFLSTFQIRPERGVIYDRTFTQLVFNKSSFNLMVDKRLLPKDSQNRRKLFDVAARIVGKKGDELEREVEEGEELIAVVGKKLSHEALLMWEEKQNELPGFFLESNLTRDYQDGSVFSHLIGYTSRVNAADLEKFSGYSLQDSIGRTGVERAYEEILRGKPGLLEGKQNGKGAIAERKKILDPEPGKSLVLWLDAALQKKLTESLERSLRNVGAKKAAAVAIDPRTGGILAFQSLPSFDNNMFAQGISQKDLTKLQEDPLNPLLPRPIAGQYLIGSTIKPFIAAAALQEKIISEKTNLFAPLELCLKNLYSGEKECFGDWTFHGWTDVKRAIAESINPFFYIIGSGYKKNEFSDPRLPDSFEGLGVERITRYLSLFGFGQKTGILLPGETTGRIPDPEWKKQYFKTPQNQIWYIGDTYNLSIGQGYFLATPLQVAMAVGAIANGGTLFQPQVVQKIVDKEKNTVVEFSPQVVRKGFIDEQNLRIVREGMRQAVRAGSASFLSSLPVSSGAKTGTAQVSANSDLYENWISVFAPYDNPEIVLTVLVEDVRGIQAAALPVAKEVLEWYFTR